MRRRVGSPTVAASGAFPAELALGRCTEVWADDRGARAWNSARSRWKRAFDAYCDERGITGIQARQELCATGAPWSVTFLIAQGAQGLVEERFAKAGVTLGDVPDLRRAARARVAALKRGGVHVD